MNRFDGFSDFPRIVRKRTRLLDRPCSSIATASIQFWPSAILTRRSTVSEATIALEPRCASTPFTRTTRSFTGDTPALMSNARATSPAPARSGTSLESARVGKAPEAGSGFRSGFPIFASHRSVTCARIRTSAGSPPSAFNTSAGRFRQAATEAPSIEPKRSSLSQPGEPA